VLGCGDRGFSSVLGEVTGAEVLGFEPVSEMRIVAENNRLQLLSSSIWNRAPGRSFLIGLLTLAYKKILKSKGKISVVIRYRILFMTKFKTDQEKFWAEEFGTDYIGRNQDPALLAANLKMFSDVFASCKSSPTNILELGANIGMNVKSLQLLAPGSEVTAVEINSDACSQLAKTGCNVIQGSILEVDIPNTFDFVFTKGVLIHINPEELGRVYDVMYKSSSRYIMIAEYYNPSPVGVIYRGIPNRLFKRDFAGEMLDKFTDLRLVDYGFCYHRGNFAQDDITWFLLEKSNA